MAEEVAVYEGVTYPIEAWRLVYEYVVARRAPDARFNRRMRALGVKLSDAYGLYRAQLYTPWEITFVKPFPPPPPYQHKVIVCNISTERAGVRITISITLWFDVRTDVMERYVQEAVAKIHRWLDASFYGNITGIPEQAKLSEEDKKTKAHIVRELVEKKELATDIHYSFYWFRVRKGVTEKAEGSPEEPVEGDIGWDEEIPLTMGAGARRGKKGREIPLA